MLTLLSCPTEIHLMIISEAFGLYNLQALRFLDRAMRKERRALRLKMFCRIAVVCKTWLDPARTVFWSEVALFTVGELVAFSRAVQHPSSKPACIRSLHLRLPQNIDQKSPPRPKEELLKEAKEAKAEFPAALRLLPAHLDELRVDCDNHHPARNHVLYHSISTACQDPTWIIDIPYLRIGPRPSLLLDTFTYFRFTRNVRHLELSFTSRDDSQTFGSPLPLMQLDSLVLRMKFDGVTYLHRMPFAASAVAKVLRQSCTTLRSLFIHLLAVDEIEPSKFIQTMKNIFSLLSPSLSTFKLRARTGTPETENPTLILTSSKAFVPCPTLRKLYLDDVGLTPEVFRQLKCTELRELEVEVKKPGSFEFKARLFRCLAVPELRNIEVLKINCPDLESTSLWFDELSDIELLRIDCGDPQSTALWFDELSTTCAVRNILFIVQSNPEE